MSELSASPSPLTPRPARMGRHLRLLVETDHTNTKRTRAAPGGRRLKLNGPDLDDLPAELFAMTDLEVLDLSPERQSCIYYHLGEVPRDISKLVNLRILMLDTNRLYDLPDELCLLPHLEKLSLSNNHLSDLPNGFNRLQSLQSLHAANNEFSALPEAVCSLSQLHFLDMSDNRIANIPTSIRNLNNLETFILFKNSLTSLPDSICDLHELRLLWLGENQIKRLPRKISNLKNLDWGRTPHTLSTVLDGNPLTHPPLSVCKAGPETIENYFRLSEARNHGNSRNRKPVAAANRKKMSVVKEMGKEE